ncbi:MAG: hypothetical protein KGY74_09075 [Candidatus Cloacimonetes bacterium]|nr:hypothetical protein [Candidatus Cloacimonadota bacterium]
MEIKKVIKEFKEQIEKTANVKSLFGEPTEVGELTIIPVASVDMKGGGGGGIGTAGKPKKKQVAEEEIDIEEKEEAPAPEGKGGGMGLNVKANPVGYIEIKDDNSRFVEIVDKSKIIFKVIKIIGVLLILGSIKNLFKRKKKK